MNNKVEELIKCSLRELGKVTCENNSIKKQESKLIFPTYCDGKKRISEQEARFLFVRELEKQSDFYYSIETPTKKSYKDFKTNKPKIEENDGRSASIDLSIYDDKFQRKHLIEFKFRNVPCKKDFLKLLCDDEQCKTNYYINILENCNNRTIQSIEKKIKESIEYVSENYKNIICSEVKIFIFIYGENKAEALMSNNFLEYRFSNNTPKPILIHQEVI